MPRMRALQVMASSAAFRSRGHWIISHAPCGVHMDRWYGCGSRNEVGTVLCVAHLPVVYGTVTCARDRSDKTHWTSGGTFERRIVDPVSFRVSYTSYTNPWCDRLQRSYA